LRGARDGLRIEPKMPREWEGMKVTREFRGATFVVSVERGDGDGVKVVVDGAEVEDGLVRDVVQGKTYTVDVRVPR
jgi:cellobionic acid phosphorylase